VRLSNDATAPLAQLDEARPASTFPPYTVACAVNHDGRCQRGSVEIADVYVARLATVRSRNWLKSQSSMAAVRSHTEMVLRSIHAGAATGLKALTAFPCSRRSSRLNQIVEVAAPGMLVLANSSLNTMPKSLNNMRWNWSCRPSASRSKKGARRYTQVSTSLSRLRTDGVEHRQARMESRTRVAALLSIWLRL
jgi:hypothetical protein